MSLLALVVASLGSVAGCGTRVVAPTDDVATACADGVSPILFAFEVHATELDAQNRSMMDELERSLRSEEGRPVAFRVRASASHCEAQAGDDVDALMRGRAEALASLVRQRFPDAAISTSPAGVIVGGCSCEPSTTEFCCRPQQWAYVEVRYCGPESGGLPRDLNALDPP